MEWKGFTHDGYSNEKRAKCAAFFPCVFFSGAGVNTHTHSMFLKYACRWLTIWSNQNYLPLNISEQVALWMMMMMLIPTVIPIVQGQERAVVFLKTPTGVSFFVLRYVHAVSGMIHRHLMMCFICTSCPWIVTEKPLWKKHSPWNSFGCLNAPTKRQEKNRSTRRFIDVFKYSQDYTYVSTIIVYVLDTAFGSQCYDTQNLRQGRYHKYVPIFFILPWK